MKYLLSGFVACVLLCANVPAQAHAQSSAQLMSPVSCPVLSKSLGLGRRGAEVVGLQVFLVGQGLLSPDSVTGYFGKATESAVKQWQSKMGLVTSGTPQTTGYGFVGKKTRNAIAALCAKTSSTPVNSSGQSPSITAAQSAKPTQQVAPKESVTPVNMIAVANTSSDSIRPLVVGSAQSSVLKGAATTLTVQTTGAMHYCIVSGGVYGTGQNTTLPNWSGTSGYLTQTTSFVVTCTTSSGATYSESVTVAVTQAPASQSSPQTPTDTSSTVTPGVATLISSAHRYAATMFGGWGAHLGHLMRANDGSLWFVDDTGNDVSVNPAINYYHQVNGSWQLKGTQSLLGVVQQNMGSVTDGTTLYSYGVDVANSLIVECRFNTVAMTPAGCAHLSFPAGVNANYIGATISSAGTRLVWWTNVAPSAGTWSYIYNSGGGWSGPVTSATPGYNDFSYVVARLSSNSNRVDVLGSAAKGSTAADGYDALYASTVLGSAVSDWVSVGANATALDMWRDNNGGTHSFIYPGARYIYKPLNGTLAIGSSLHASAIGARLITSSDTLHLVLSINDGTLLVKSLPIASVTGKIDWASIPSVPLTTLPAIGNKTMYPESTMYQTTPTLQANVALNGSSAQASVYHLPL